jgi:hypothetical protein
VARSPGSDRQRLRRSQSMIVAGSGSTSRSPDPAGVAA